METRCPKCNRLTVTNVATTGGKYDICKTINCDYMLYVAGDKPAVEPVEEKKEFVRGDKTTWWGQKRPEQGQLIPAPVVQTTSEDGTHYYVGSKCRHWRQKVKVGKGQLTCSSYLTDKGLDPRPDFGVYCCNQWQYRLGSMWTNGSYVEGLPREYPAMIVDWPDRGVVPMRTLEFLVELIYSKMRHAKKVDIGCYGGHGRTGTLLACVIAYVEKISGDEAIAAVRSRYCSHAIESREQEDFIRKYANILQSRQ